MGISDFHITNVLFFRRFYISIGLKGFNDFFFFGILGLGFTLHPIILYFILCILFFCRFCVYVLSTSILPDKHNRHTVCTVRYQKYKKFISKHKTSDVSHMMPNFLSK